MTPTTPPDEEAAINAAAEFLKLRDEEIHPGEADDDERRESARKIIAAYKAALCPPDPDVHDPQEDIRDFIQGGPEAPDTSLPGLNAL